MELRLSISIFAHISSSFDYQSAFCSDRIIIVVFALKTASIPHRPKSLSDQQLRRQGWSDVIVVAGEI
jgi:hypothetical protein